jgi:hypothetical protein
MPVDPMTLASIIQGFGGLAQTIAGARQRNVAEKEVERMVKSTKPDEGILSLYNKFLQRAETSPTDTSLYKRQMKNVGRAQAAGVGYLQKGGSKSILGGVPSVTKNAMDAALEAEGAAENLKERRVGALLPVTQLAAAEIRRPRELQLEQLLRKAAGGTEIANTGLSNLFNAFTSSGLGIGRGLGKEAPSLGNYKTGTMSRTPVGLGRASTITPRISGTPSIYLGPRISPTPTSIRPR